MVYVVDDDEDFAELIASFVGRAKNVKDRTGVKIFKDAIEAIAAMNEEIPDLIFLDVLLNGPDGFTLLNELRSYEDLARVPVVLISSLDFKGTKFREYGVVGCLNKSEMLPEQIFEYVERYA